MSSEIEYTLNVQTVDNPLTPDPNDTKFLLVTTGTADLEQVILRIMAVNPGLERETVEAVVKLEQRVIKEMTLNGMRVNTGLFSAVASPKGPGGNKWDPKVNEINITIAQGADWREAIRKTKVNVIGEKSSITTISKTTDAMTRGTLGEASPGYPLRVEGTCLKIAGTDPSVGIYLIAEDGTETKVDSALWALNEPQTLSFVVPAGLAEGTYTLRIVTQYASSGTLVKTPRVAERTVYIGVTPPTAGTGSGTVNPGGGEEETGGTEQGGGEDQEEDPLA